MEDTSYQNPHGLSNKFNYSTCNDLSLLTSEAMKNDLFREIVKTKTYKTQIF